MSNGSGVSRGDGTGMHGSQVAAAVPVTHAVVGIDLADRKQMVVVTDHDSKVLARAPSGSRRGTSELRWTGPPSGPRGPGSSG